MDTLHTYVWRGHVEKLEKVDGFVAVDVKFISERALRLIEWLVAFVILSSFVWCEKCSHIEFIFLAGNFREFIFLARNFREFIFLAGNFCEFIFLVDTFGELIIFEEFSLTAHDPTWQQNLPMLITLWVYLCLSWLFLHCIAHNFLYCILFLVFDGVGWLLSFDHIASDMTPKFFVGHNFVSLPVFVLILFTSYCSHFSLLCTGFGFRWGWLVVVFRFWFHHKIFCLPQLCVYTSVCLFSLGTVLLTVFSIV